MDIMNIMNLYKDFSEAGKQPCGRGDDKRAEKVRRYMSAKQKLFEALKEAYTSGELRSNRAYEIVDTISKSKKNPESFWGSSKIANSNQAMFIHEMNERLFEELAKCWCDVEQHHGARTTSEG